LDQRQTQIEVGAGQTESRINREFVDLLRKWSTPVLVLLVVGAGVWWGVQYLQQQRQQKQSTAWRELSAARLSATPEALLKVAEDHADEGSVALEARLEAADRLLNAGISGVRPGAERDGATGQLKDSAKGILSKAERATMFEQAGAQYDKVMQGSSGVAARTILFVNAALGKAAVLESLEKWPEAAAAYAAAAEAATKAGLDDQAALARQLADGIDAARKTVLPVKTDVRSMRLIESQFSIPDPNGAPAQPTPGVPDALKPPEPAPAPAPAPGPAPVPTPSPTPAPPPAPGG
jgi:hypothetical protein